MSTSPAQRFLGRRCKTLHTALLQPRFETSEDKQALNRLNDRQKFYYNRQAKSLPPLTAGETVRMQLPGEKTWTPGVCKVPWPRRPLIPSYMSQATCSRPKRLALVPSDLLSPQATCSRPKRLAIAPSDSLSSQATRSRPKRLALTPSDSLPSQATRSRPKRLAPVPSDSLSPQATRSRPKRLALVTCPKRLKRPTRSTFQAAPVSFRFLASSSRWAWLTSVHVTPQIRAAPRVVCFVELQ